MPKIIAPSSMSKSKPAPAPAPLPASVDETPSTPKNKSKSKSKPKSKDVKDPPKDKEISIPLMRCVGQLKSKINNDANDNLKEFEKTHTKFMNKLAALAEKRKNATDDEVKEEVKEEHKKLAESDEFKAHDALKKSIYRTSNDAGKYLASILEVVATSLLKYGIDNALDNDNTEKTTIKINLDKFTNASLTQTETYPLIQHLDSYESLTDPTQKPVIPRKKKVKKEEDAEAEAVEEEEEEDASDNETKPKKKTYTYKTIIHNLFKNLIAEKQLDKSKKVQCSEETRIVLSNILVDLTNRLSDSVEILVRDIGKAHTVTDLHLESIIKLIFIHHNTNGSATIDKIKKLYDSKKKVKDSSE